MSKQKKVIIFDFDGTLADTAPLIRKIYNEIAERDGLKEMTEEIYADLRKGSLKDARRWSGIRFWQFPRMVWSVRKLLNLESEKVKLFPGIVDLVATLEAEGHDLYILSRNSPDTIYRVLERYKLKNKFTVLHLKKRNLGSKSATILSLIRKKSLSRSTIWMVGDEVRDIQAARRARIKSVAVDWGLQDEAILSLQRPTHLVTTVKQLTSILK